MEVLPRAISKIRKIRVKKIPQTAGPHVASQSGATRVATISGNVKVRSLFSLKLIEKAMYRTLLVGVWLRGSAAEMASTENMVYILDRGLIIYPKILKI